MLAHQPILRSGRNEVGKFLGGPSTGGSDDKLTHQHYATLSFASVDSSESNLSILNPIQIFVETLVKRFENGCEFNFPYRQGSQYCCRNNGGRELVLETR